MTSSERPTKQPSDIASVVSRIKAATKLVTINGLFKVRSFTDGDGCPVIYMLYFRPRSMPDFRVNLRLEPTLADDSADLIAEALTRSIQSEIDNERRNR